MKEAFFDALCELAKENPNIEFLKADAGFNAKYQFGYPKQYSNIGISEQNMIALAAGMALEGKTVFAYSLVDFASIRCLDQIRVDAGYNKINVKIVSCGTGFDYCDDGVSHIAIDDISALRAIPNLILFSPCDPHEAYAVTKAAALIQGPCFIRLGRGAEPALHKERLAGYKVGEAVVLKPGTDIMIFVTGSIAIEALAAANHLSSYDVGVYSFPTVKPIDRNFILRSADKARLIVTLEEHIVAGGFGGAVAEILAETAARKAVFKRIGVDEDFANSPEVHSPENLRSLFFQHAPPAFMKKHCKITARDVEETIRGMIG
jgi:transketolase